MPIRPYTTVCPSIYPSIHNRPSFSIHIPAPVAHSHFAKQSSFPFIISSTAIPLLFYPPVLHLLLTLSLSLSLSFFAETLRLQFLSFPASLLSSPLLLPFSSLHAVYPFPPRRRAGAVTSRTSLSRVFLFLNRLPWRREGWREILKERSSFSTGVCRQSSKHPARNRRTRFITHDEQTVDGLGRGLAACVSFAERLIVALRSV